MYGFQNGYGNYSSYSNPSYPAVVPPHGNQQQQNAVFGSSSAPNPFPYTAPYGYGAANPTTNNATAAAASAYAQANQLADAYSAAIRTYSTYSNPQSNAQGGYFRGTGSNAAQNKAALPQANSANKPTPPAGSYNNYDAAVFAAASSLLHSKNTGQGNLWMNNKRGNYPQRSHTGPGFNKRFTNATVANKDVQQFYCELCKVSCAGQLTYKEHLDGQKHKKKELLEKGATPQTLPKNKVSFRCDLCNVTCTGQDTYNAHVRGAKHVKTLALCKKLGKPIPSNEPTIIPPLEMTGAAPTGAVHAAQEPSVKRVVGISTVNFVGGTKLNSTGQLEAKKAAVAEAVGSAGLKPQDEATANAVKAQSEELQALIAAEQNVQPVGEEYVESQRDSTGKLLQYLCKLCDCKFSDPNAKEIHLKGRRHRLQYKQKVDPTLEVEVKVQSTKRANKVEPRVARRFPPASALPGVWFGGPPCEGRRFELIDERHVKEKHMAIDLNREMVVAYEEYLKEVEDILKKVSEELEKAEGVKQIRQEDGAAPVKTERILTGVTRIGPFAKGVMLKSDPLVDVVLNCSPVPTAKLVSDVKELFVKLADNYKSEEDSSPACFIVAKDNMKLKCRIILTSRLLRNEQDLAVGADCVDKERCLEALAELRRLMWFQVRCSYLKACKITLRLLRDIRQRIASWQPITDWMCELLVEKILVSCPTPLSPSDALRRVLEAFAGGILLTSGPRIMDPCEKEPINVLKALTNQQREDITSSAQHALRLIAFNQIYKVLGIERLPDTDRAAEMRGALFSDRKRPNEGSVNGDDVKKDKKEEEAEVVEKKPII